jgi:lysophospholipid acyltransferase (LPLAT)-like uncharacterized protein
MKWLFRRARVQAVLACCIAWYLKWVLRWQRWSVDGVEHLAPQRAGEPAIVAFWHEALPLMPALLEQSRRNGEYQGGPIFVLVSQHHDGRLIGGVLERFGITPVLGSTSRGGRAAMLTLAKRLQSSAVVAITPDGPRGPARTLAVGVVKLAGLSGVPIVPCGAAARWRVPTRTWDRMGVPLPFGRAVLSCRPPLVVAKDTWEAELERVRSELTEAQRRAEQLCVT